MGGMSFKCPLCDRWTLSVHSLRAHLKDKHELKNVQFDAHVYNPQIIASEKVEK